MMLLAMTALLIDAIFGLFFKALVLVPAIVVVSATTLHFGMAYNNSLWSTLLLNHCCRSAERVRAPS